jgi:hypothetical protein
VELNSVVVIRSGIGLTAAESSIDDLTLELVGSNLGVAGDVMPRRWHASLETPSLPEMG